jgi:short-subunit dehydrogenase
MKRILIIGATSAIANASARLWAARGASLFLVARDEAKLAAAAADLAVRGASVVHRWQMDANDLPAHEEMIKASVQALGSLDVALIAHGTLSDQSACEADPRLALQQFTTNATSVIALLTLLANEFERQRAGTIAVITSVAGERGRPRNYVYGSAKAAVSAFCEGLRARLHKSGVSLTDIRPGFVATPMTEGLALPAPLVAQPEVVARRIVDGIERRSDIVYAPAFWAPIMGIIRNIPRPLFKRLNL